MRVVFSYQMTDRKRLIALFLSLIWFCTVACATSGTARTGQQTAQQIRDLDAEVLSAILIEGDRQVVLNRTSSTCLNPASFSESYILPSDAELPQDVVASFNFRNSNHGVLPSLGPTTEMITPDDLREMMGQDYEAGWERVRNTYGRIASFSFPGYSSDFSEALVCATYSWGNLAAEGWFIYLRRTNGNWQVTWRALLIQAT